MLNTKPPNKRTGHSNPDCYARGLRDCSEAITREHYISKKLLELMGEFTGEGFAWGPEVRSLSAKALRAWVLCKRHNEALSPLDDNITQLYELMRRWQDRKVIGDLVLDGEDLERWAIKVLFGLFASGGARMVDANGRQVPRTRTIPKHYLRVLFGDGALRPGAGFHYGRVAFEGRPNAFRCRVDWSLGDAIPKSIVCSLVGFTWITTLDPEPPPPHVYRPSDFDIGETGRLTVHWNGARRFIEGNPRIKLFEIVEQREGAKR